MRPIVVLVGLLLLPVPQTDVAQTTKNARLVENLTRRGERRLSNDQQHSETKIASQSIDPHNRTSLAREHATDATSGDGCERTSPVTATTASARVP